MSQVTSISDVPQSMVLPPFESSEFMMSEWVWFIHLVDTVRIHAKRKLLHRSGMDCDKKNRF